MGEPTRVRISDASGAGLEEVEAQFNPTEYSITRGVSYAEIAVPGLSLPLLQFVRGETQTLSAELLFDGSDERVSITERLDRLRRYTEINSDLHAPPVCRFRWGAEPAFVGVITQLQEKFTLFDNDGKILRARVTVTMKRYEPARSQARSTSTASPDRFKTRVVKAGDRLDLIALAEYGDATLWRPIAALNNLTRPRVLVPGTVLRIPPL